MVTINTNRFYLHVTICTRSSKERTDRGWVYSRFAKEMCAWFGQKGGVVSMVDWSLGK